MGSVADKTASLFSKSATLTSEVCEVLVSPVLLEVEASVGEWAGAGVTLGRVCAASESREFGDLVTGACGGGGGVRGGG